MLFLKSGINKLQASKLVSAVIILLTLAMLSSCETTTTGGFLVDTSNEQAAADYIQLALAYLDVGDMAGARRHANNTLNISDRSSDAYMVLAMIFQHEGDSELADSNFRRALSLDRENSRARNNYAALLFSQERYHNAFEQLERVSNDTNYEGRALAFEGLGRSAIRLNRQEDARNAFVRALRLNTRLYISALELAWIYFDQQDYQRARQTYQNYLTAVEFYNVPHTPRALLAGIQIEGHFQNSEFVENFSRVLSTLYPGSPEYQTYQELTDAN